MTADNVDEYIHEVIDAIIGKGAQGCGIAILGLVVLQEPISK